jgi:hypothetical protein
VALMLAGTLTGCGSMSTSPLTDMNQDMAGGATMDGAGASTMPSDDGPEIEAPPNVAPTAQPSTLQVLAPFTPGTSSGMNENNSDVQASKGGTLKNGRWTLDIPKNALAGDAQITFGVPSASSWGCELQISPADLNHFAAPVQLTVDCNGVSKKKLALYAIFCYDAVHQTWLRVPGSKVDTKKKTVTAPLSHFSIYCVKPSA